MNNISKYFSINNTQALDSMSLEIEKGEIHAIVGENGAGKSTLMKILHGIEHYDSGNITILGRTGMVSQHFRLINEFSILDNIIIGSEPTKHLFIINRSRAKARIDKIFTQYGFQLNLKTKVTDLSVGQKQLVEIIKVIYNDAQILIFDEPTAALSEQESEKLREMIISLKKNGKTVIIISHKIKDISAISDRFTIIRKGQYIETVITKDVDLKEISHHMSGKDIVETLIDTQSGIKEPIKTFQFAGKSITIHKGEILGFTGYGGCGLHQLESLLEKQALIDPKMSYAPSDRLLKGVEINSKLKNTLIAKKRRDFTHFGFLKNKEIDNYAQDLINRFDIKGSVNCQTGTLSGGNLQKAVIARVLDENPEILILSSPTWGIDINSTNEIYANIKEFKKNNRGIILLSYDVEEIKKLSNRIIVMYKNRIIKEVTNEEKITPRVIGKLSAGIIDD